MTYRVVFAPSARTHLAAVQAYLASAADPDTASAFVNGVIAHAMALRDFPRRGTRRDDLGPGFRTTVWRQRVTIIYVVEERAVVVVGVAYGGRDLEELLRQP